MEPQRLRAMIASAQRGSSAAYETLLEEFGPRLYGYFFRATGSHHDAEDLLGEILLRLVKQLRKYDDRGRFEPWVFRIAANMVRDRIRRIKAAPARMSLSAEDDSGATLMDQLPGDAPAPSDGMLTAEEKAELYEALDRLDLTTREMILLRHFGELSFKEIAGIFGCPLGTVLARVHRGMGALRKLMGVPDED